MQRPPLGHLPFCEPTTSYVRKVHTSLTDKHSAAPSLYQPLDDWIIREIGRSLVFSLRAQAVEVTPTGRKVFMLQYHRNSGVRRKPALGQLGELQCPGLVDHYTSHR